jgi:hypothetical protein
LAEKRGKTANVFRIYALGVCRVKKVKPLPKAIESPDPPTAYEIAKLADRSDDVSRFFTNAGKMMPQIQPVTSKPAAFLYEI